MRRSLLFLPGNSPNMLMNGDVLGADALILDLEDAVAPDEKDAARILVRNAIKTLPFEGVEIVVRINALDGSRLWLDDLAEIVPLRPQFIMPTKVPDAAYVLEISQQMARIEQQHGIPEGSVGLIPLIESALGLENAFQIALADKRVAAVFLGAEDLTADLRCRRTMGGQEIFYARARMVAAARAAGIEVYDTPFTDVYDDDGLLEDIKLAKALGFSGKAAISPRHVQAINGLFSPGPEEIEYAREVLAAIEEAGRLGKGAVSLGGKMIDAPIVSRARQVLEMERAIRGGPVDD